MAYQKTFTNAAGFSGDYWRLTSFDVKKVQGVVEVVVSCYKDKAARDSKKVPFASKSFSLKLSDIDLSKDIQEEIYKAIKNAKSKTGIASVNEVPFFADATIV